MASSREYLDFVLDQLSVAEGISWKPMMGEYLLYCRGKLIGGVYDNRLLVKATASARAMMPTAPLEPPYDGAKPLLLVEEMENKPFLASLCRALYDDLPTPRKKK